MVGLVTMSVAMLLALICISYNLYIHFKVKRREAAAKWADELDLEDDEMLANITNKKDCVKWAVATCKDLYYDEIRDFLALYPPDKVNADKSLFWASPRRRPVPLRLHHDVDGIIGFVLET